MCERIINVNIVKLKLMHRKSIRKLTPYKLCSINTRNTYIDNELIAINNL